MKTTRLWFLATIFLSIVYKCSSIYCFYCSSANNSACIDPMMYDEETRAHILPIVNCDTSVVARLPEQGFFCRKIVQTIYHPHKDSDLRVTRGCGWVRQQDSLRDCYRADTRDHLETVCQCFTDHCNSAASNTAGMVLMALGAVVFYLR